MGNYQDLIGKKFKPTFETEVDHYEIRGYDESREMVLTTVYTKGGHSFEDEIEEKYLAGALATGDYVPIHDHPKVKPVMMTLTNPYNAEALAIVKGVKFQGPCCSRCVNRYGGSNRRYCEAHCNDDNCLRFKLEQ